MTHLCSRVEKFIADPNSAPSAFETLARDVFEFQFHHNAPYGAFCESRGITPDRLESLDDIPAIITTAFKDLELTSIPLSDRTAVFHSSGTTQHRPSRHFHSDATLRLYEKSLTHWFQPNIVPGLAHVNFLFLSPRASEAPHSSLVHMFETLAKTFGASEPHFCATTAPDGGWSLTSDRVLAAQTILRSERIPTVICGTAFSFVELCDFLSTNNRSLIFPPGSRIFETGGYKGRSRVLPKHLLREMISRFLSIPETHIIGEYGMSEVSSQAYDRQPGQITERLYHFPPWARAIVISPETGRPVADGETGLLRILDLANVGSVMAIQTEDLARRQGNAFELLGRASLAEARGCSLLHANS